MIKTVIFIMICAGITSITISSILQSSFAYHTPFTSDLITPEMFCSQFPNNPSCVHDYYPYPGTPVCPEWDPQCESTDPFFTPRPSPFPPSGPRFPSLDPFNCGINPYAPPCNIPCFNYNNPYCKDDILKEHVISRANVTITITNNQTQHIQVLEGHPKEITLQLLNQTNVPYLTGIEKDMILKQINNIIKDLILSSPIFLPPFDTNFKTTFETKYGLTTTKDGNIIYQGIVKVEIKMPIILPGMLPSPFPYY